MVTQNNRKPPYLIVISAPSGAGKTTLCKRVLADFPKVVLSISSTTRLPRGSEQNGVEYFFLNRETFEKQIQANEFAEWATVHENYYGTSKEVIQKAFSQELSVLLDIDVQGAALLQKAFPQQCYRIFVSPPSLQELEFRLRARGTDTDESIRKRLTNAQNEMNESSKFDLVIVNDTLEKAYKQLKKCLEETLHLYARKGQDG